MAPGEQDKHRWFPQDRVMENSYIVGDVLARGAHSTLRKCLFKGKTERACKIYRKVDLNKETVILQMQEVLKFYHPNIIRTYDVFETRTDIQVVTELLTGRELFEHIVECGQYTEQKAATAIGAVLSALKCLHSRSVIHSRVRPENLLYQSSSENALLKLSDVSMPKVHNHNHNDEYTAPEIIRGEQATSSSDIWSLGVVLYIMLCGFEPWWVNKNDGATALVDFAFPSPWWDEVSASAKDLITQMTDKSAQSRLTADAALRHSWVRCKTVRLQHMGSTVDLLKEFNARRKFRVATKAVLATHRAMSLVTSQRMKVTLR